VALVRIDVSEERITSNISELGALSVTEARLTVTANVVPSWLILFTLMMEAIRSSETSVVAIQPYGFTFKKEALFTVTAP
jgi:hypothetical protein